MKTTLILAILLLAATPTIQAQTMTTEQLQQQCVDFDNEFRAAILAKVDHSTTTPITLRKFIPYLDAAYSPNTKDGKSQPLFYSKQTDAGRLLRIGEGWYKMEKTYDNHLKKFFMRHSDIKETAYFFLNDSLVCVSRSIGSLDYNYAPSAYWVDILTVDIFYQNGEVVKKNHYWISGMHPFSYQLRHEQPSNRPPFIDEEWNKDEPQLKERAYKLYNAGTNDVRQQ